MWNLYHGHAEGYVWIRGVTDRFAVCCEEVELGSSLADSQVQLGKPRCPQRSAVGVAEAWKVSLWRGQARLR